MVETVKDPVCGMQLRPQDAAVTEVQEGRTVYLCSHACHDAFISDRQRYLSAIGNRSGGQHSRE